jgi:hypothetical protein
MVSFTSQPLYPSGERAPGTHWIEEWVSPETDMKDVERGKILLLPGFEL